MILHKNIMRSLWLARRIGAVPNHCFHNGQMTLAVYGTPDQELHTAVYTEGFLFVPGGGGVHEHGWIEHDGEILDPTIPDTSARYYPALRWTRAEVIEYWEASAGGTIARVNPTYLMSPAWRTAYLAALLDAGAARSMIDPHTADFAALSDLVARARRANP